jgi:hypothetical protein
MPKVVTFQIYLKLAAPARPVTLADFLRILNSRLPDWERRVQTIALEMRTTYQKKIIFARRNDLEKMNSAATNLLRAINRRLKGAAAPADYPQDRVRRLLRRVDQLLTYINEVIAEAEETGKWPQREHHYHLQ